MAALRSQRAAVCKPFSCRSLMVPPALAVSRELARAATVYAWPLEKRGMDAKGNRGALHVKCAVVDDEAALISSANLTEHAMNLNMELGLQLLTGEQLPDLE